jgi:glycosyltransferase involved in cell wall biosynthesis
MKKSYTVLLALMGLQIGGAETHAVELAKGLKKEGFHVIIASNGGVYESELLRYGISHIHVPLHNKKPWNVVKSYILLKQIIKKENIDIVHAHARIPALLCSLLNKKMKFHFVTTAHGIRTKVFGTMWGEKTIVVSEDIKNHLVKDFAVDPKDIIVTVNGIDIERFNETVELESMFQELCLRTDSKKVVYVSRMDQDRRDIIFQLLDVAENLVDTHPQVDVLLVGDGSIFEEVRSKVEVINKKVRRRAIILPGGRTDINRFIAVADVFIGFGRSSLEAMAAGKPTILAGNAGYIGIFKADRLDVAMKTNFSCRGMDKVDNIKFYEDILKVLSLDEQEARNLGAYGKEVVETYYSMRKMVKDNAGVYLELLEIQRGSL